MMNVPNKISLARILAMPVFMLFFLLNFPGAKFVALGIFILATISDAVDGHIARKYNLITDFGKFLDPIADKLLATTGLIFLIVGETPIIPNPYGAIFMFIMIQRDYVVTGLRQIAQLKGVVIAADKWAKIKANFLYASLIYGLVIAALRDFTVIAESGFMTYFTIVFYVIVGITAVLIVNSEVIYLAHNFHVFKEEKKEEVVEEKAVETVAVEEVEEKPAAKKTTTKTTKAPAKKPTTTKKTTTAKKTTPKKAEK